VKSKKQNNVFEDSKLKKTLLEWSINVDINCVQKMMLYKETILIQLIWFCILFGSTGATLFLITKSIMDYLKHDVITQIKLVNEMPANFPTITFCDNNPFSTLRAEEFMHNISIMNNITDHETIFNLAKIYASSDLLSDEERKSFGNLRFNCISRVGRCQINDLHWYWSFDHGNCFQFNSGFNLNNQRIDLVNITKNGEDYFWISIYPIINLNNFVTTWNSGLVVFVHNNTFDPLEKVFIETGKETVISVKRTFTQKCASPYSDCIDLKSYKSDLYDYIIKSNRTYRQEDCFELCIQRSIIEECECYFTAYSDDLNTNIRACLNQTDVECLNDKIDRFNLIECQTTLCPLECDSITYDLTLSSLEWPDERAYDYYYNNDDFASFYSDSYNLTLSYDVFKSTQAAFSVYYPSLKYTHISESPKTEIIDLFTQIGGSLGMFVSFSIFTIFEFIEVSILILREIVVVACSKRSF
jgi:hypothetical protein